MLSAPLYLRLTRRFAYFEHFQQWCFQETAKLERKRKELERGEKLLEQEKSLLNMKLDILKEEYRKLADEKEQFKREKQYHAWEEQKREQKKERKTYESGSTLTMKPELFFRGVGNELMLKKRYKDLIKIYHPDNVAGDTRTVQEINKEYEKMKQLFL